MSRVYYGWWLVAGLFVVLTVSSGFGFYNLSVYMNVLSESRGFAVSDISIAVSLFFVVGGLAGMWVARLLDRYDVRLIMISGAALSGIALGLVGHATELAELYVLFVIFGIGNSGVSIIVSTTLVTRWFPGPNRSVALSIASTGLSFGGVVLTPLSATLLNSFPLVEVIPWFGVAFFTLIAPIAWFLVRFPDTDTTLPGHAEPDSDWSHEAAIRTRFFVMLTIAYVLCMGVQVGGIAHLYNHAENLAGYQVAANAVRALTVASILGRFLGGWLVTKISIRGFALCNAGIQSIGLAVIALADTNGWILLGASIFGVSIGNLLMLQPLWLAEAFGVKAHSRVFSLSNALTVAGVAGGPLLLGILFEVSGYALAYFLAAGVSVVSLGAMLAAGAAPELAERTAGAS